MGPMPTSKGYRRGVREGYRSGLEGVTAEYLRQQGVDAEYESTRIPYTPPQRVRRYTPDFILPNGIIIETKGRFVTADRQKHKWIKAEHPSLDIRFVFSRSSNKINKGSKTTYAMWCLKEGFLFADGLPPEEWLREPANDVAIAALKALQHGKT